jgi:hypothetical protein
MFALYRSSLRAGIFVRGWHRLIGVFTLALLKPNRAI